MNATLIEVKPTEVTPSLWEGVRDLVDSICAVSGGRFELSDMLSSILSGYIQLWMANIEGKTKGIALSEIRVYPHLKELHTFAATGEDHDLWESLIEQIEAWGKTRGCHISKCTVRPGWRKPLQSHGYKATHFVMEKVIGHVH